MDDTRPLDRQLGTLRQHAGGRIRDEHRDVAGLRIADIEIPARRFEIHFARSSTAAFDRIDRGHAAAPFVDGKDRDAVVATVRRVEELPVRVHRNVRG